MPLGKRAMAWLAVSFGLILPVAWWGVPGPYHGWCDAREHLRALFLWPTALARDTASRFGLSEAIQRGGREPGVTSYLREPHAVRWRTLAAEAGHAEGIRRLGLAGDEHWLGIGAKAGDVECQRALRALLIEHFVPVRTPEPSLDMIFLERPDPAPQQ